MAKKMAMYFLEYISIDNTSFSDGEPFDNAKVSLMVRIFFSTFSIAMTAEEAGAGASTETSAGLYL